MKKSIKGRKKAKVRVKRVRCGGIIESLGEMMRVKSRKVRIYI